MMLAVQPKSKKKTLLSPIPKSINKKAQRTAVAAPASASKGIYPKRFKGFGIAVLCKAVMEKR